MRTFALLATAALLCRGGDPATAIRRLLQNSPEAKQCFFGIVVENAASGEVIYSLNADKLFVPASNTKLITTSLALRRLGPDYKFRTSVQADALPDGAGRVRGLRMIGGGDPSLSPRLIPYNKDETGPDPLAAIKELADQIAAKGVRIVDGDIAGDDTAYLWEPYPVGWGNEDTVYGYGAPVSALTLDDNTLRVTVAPGTAGSPGTIVLEPAIEYLTVHNRTQTVDSGSGRITYTRLGGTRELVVGGTVSVVAEPSTTVLAVDDPALFAASALRGALEERGIRVTGQPRVMHRLSEAEPFEQTGIELASRESPPLSMLVEIVNKVSHNLHAELLLREVARAATGVGSRKAGLEQVSAYLKELGVEDEDCKFEDASGLSRLNLVTPRAIVRVLGAIYGTPLRDVWTASLPVGGVDGSLENRFKHSRKAGQIHAKTGSLGHVSALSGYALRRDGSTYVFSILVNNFKAPQNTIRPVIDKIALALLD